MVARKSTRVDFFVDCGKAADTTPMPGRAGFHAGRGKAEPNCIQNFVMNYAWVWFRTKFWV